MNEAILKCNQWLLNLPNIALNKAYNISKKIFFIQKEYLAYKNIVFTSQKSWRTIVLYIDSELNECLFKIKLNLFEFYIYKYIIDIIYIPIVINFNKLFNSTNSFQYNLLYLEKKIVWIEAVLEDLSLWRTYYLDNYLSNNKKNNKNSILLNQSTSSPNLALTYESIGLIPRSITRTLSRFQSELAGNSYPLIIKEFRIAKYYTLASLQYIFYLVSVPWLTNFICRKLFLESYIEQWWNTSQSQIFLNISQEEKALKRLQNVEELLWLDIAINESSNNYPQDFKSQIHERTIELANYYNSESIETIIHIFTDLIFLFTLNLLLIFSKKRVAIFNAWVQELFYSLTDTMKAFLILLLTDLFIGFHSPHGWEIAIGDLFNHLGFANNKYLISCLVSTFPVILDTVLKYWIFRHLNRISPSIVVTYHTMNE